MNTGVSDPSFVARCPACGQTLSSPPPARCPLCSFRLIQESEATTAAGAATPAEPNAGQAWKATCEWVWYAGWGRLAHLARLQRTVASRHFARVNLVALSVLLGVFRMSAVGWHWVPASSPKVDGQGVRPAGEGWFHLAGSTPSPILTAPSADHVDLWWNAAQGLIAAGAGLVAAFVLLNLLIVLGRWALKRAHHPVARGEERMAAALHYASAWTVPLWVAVTIACARPLAFLGEAARWRWAPPRLGMELSAGVIAGFGLLLAWFWLIRLGATAPAAVRGKVSVFMVLGVPLLTLSAAAAWWYGLELGLVWVFAEMGLAF